MAKSIRNPFYYLLLAACLALLVTMFIYLCGFWFVPNPDKPKPLGQMPPLMKWVDQRAIWLIAGEVALILVLTGLTIGLDRFFESDAGSDGGSQAKGTQKGGQTFVPRAPPDARPEKP